MTLGPVMKMRMMMMVMMVMMASDSDEETTKSEQTFQKWSNSRGRRVQRTDGKQK